MKVLRRYQNLVLKTREGKICRGDFILNDGELTLRCDSEGYLNDSINPEDGMVLPAVEFSDGSHIEHWKHGVLHNEEGPAVIDLDDNYQQFWKNGNQIKN